MVYLILHKVRGEPAFDIASKLRCPVCEPMRQGLDDGMAYAGNCNACDDGYWWIIPTSGHRAYPYLHWNMDDLFDGSDINKNGFHNKPIDLIEGCPADWPDHYPMDVGSPPKPDLNIMALISNLLPKVKDRRF